jgi:CubicO group peptidase (beta-lactamase class C family)
MTSDATLRSVDGIFERLHAGGEIPGIAYGVVIGGDLVHARGLGTLHHGEDRTPDADSIFRIASMTKSFTASAVLLLRDEGALALDEPVGTYVPELAGFRGPTADAPLITIRHLLTMTSGLATDDPWGDRLQGLALDRFAELLSGGFTFAWPTGTAFEYSNLGYGILGRVLTNVSGVEYRDLIRERVLAPLGMEATGFDATEFEDRRLARGHVHRDGAFLDEPFDDYGALASMGGVFSSVRDLATWVHGFTEAFPARDEPLGPYPLARSSRREMQQIHRAFDPELSWSSAGAPTSLTAGGYGFGLFVFQDLTLGHVVSHSGGYPGFGSHMRWHPASGVGVVALGNATYAGMMPASREALETVVADADSSVRVVVPWDAAERARLDVERLLVGWDDELAERVFAFNVELDEPLERRRTAFERIRERHGALTRDPEAKVERASPAHVAWWLDAAGGGRVRVELELDPERRPLIQWLELRSVAEPSVALRSIIERVVSLINASPPPLTWPDDLVPAEDRSGTGREAADRSLRIAAASFAPVTMGRPTEGDGVTSTTVTMSGPHGILLLKVSVDGEGELTQVQLVPETRTPPVSP